MKNRFSSFIILAAASVLISAIMIPADPSKIFDLAAETTGSAASTTPGDPDSEVELFSSEFQVGRHHRCYWSGIAPFCLGFCGNGYIERRRNKCGNGSCCWAGSKALCCRRTRRGPYIIPPTPHHPHRSNPPPSLPPQHLHKMHQLPSTKHGLSHYPEEGVQGDSADFFKTTDSKNTEGLDHEGHEELGDSDFLGDSERLSTLDYVVGGFGGSEEYHLERSQCDKGPGGLKPGDIDDFKKDSKLKDFEPEFLI